MKHWSSYLLIFTILFISCNQQEPTVTPLLNVPSLAYYSAQFVDMALGKPDLVTPITSYPKQMPGEHREYFLPDQTKVMIRFYQDKAVVFTV